MGFSKRGCWKEMGCSKGGGVLKGRVLEGMGGSEVAVLLF